MPIVEITDMEKHLVEKHFVPGHPDVPVRCGDVMIGILDQCASISILFSAGTFSEPSLPVNDSAPKFFSNTRSIPEFYSESLGISEIKAFSLTRV